MLKGDQYNTQRVNRMSVIVTLFVVILLCVQALFTGGMSDFIDTALKGGIVVVLCIIIFFLPINKYLKGLLFGLVPGLVTMALFYLVKFTIDKHYIIMASVAITAMYFKKELLVVYAAVMDAAIILVYTQA